MRQRSGQEDSAPSTELFITPPSGPRLQDHVSQMGDREELAVSEIRDHVVLLISIAHLRVQCLDSLTFGDDQRFEFSDECLAREKRSGGIGWSEK